jgi:hypothetical protein
MQNAFVNFLFKISLLTLVVITLAYLVFNYFLSQYYFAYFPLLISIIYIFSIAFHYFLWKSGKKSFSRFTTTYMLLTTIKLLFYLVLILIYVFAIKEKPISFIITFLALYMVFTIFEVVTLLKKN